MLVQHAFRVHVRAFMRRFCLSVGRVLRAAAERGVLASFAGETRFSVRVRRHLFCARRVLELEHQRHLSSARFCRVHFVRVVRSRRYLGVPRGETKHRHREAGFAVPPGQDRRELRLRQRDVASRRDRTRDVLVRGPRVQRAVRAPGPVRGEDAASRRDGGGAIRAVRVGGLVDVVVAVVFPSPVRLQRGQHRREAVHADGRERVRRGRVRVRARPEVPLREVPPVRAPQRSRAHAPKRRARRFAVVHAPASASRRAPRNRGVADGMAPRHSLRDAGVVLGRGGRGHRHAHPQRERERQERRAPRHRGRAREE